VEYEKKDEELIGKGTRNQQRYRSSISPYQNPYLRLLMTTGSMVLRRMASDSATDKASGLGTRKGNTSLRGSKGG
jgi:hypothetical protein